VNTEDTETLGK